MGGIHSLVCLCTLAKNVFTSYLSVGIPRMRAFVGCYNLFSLFRSGRGAFFSVVVFWFSFSLAFARQQPCRLPLLLLAVFNVHTIYSRGCSCSSYSLNFTICKNSEHVVVGV